MSILVIGSAPSLAEYRSYSHTGCAKDGVKVSETIVWDCKGACATTPLKAQIMRESRATKAIYPGIVKSLTKSQVASGAHAPKIRSRAGVKSSLTANPPKFGGKC